MFSLFNKRKPKLIFWSLPEVPLWAATREPQRFVEFGGAQLQTHTLILGTTRSGKSALFPNMKIAPQPAGKPPEHARPRQPALNSLLDVKAWALEPDEGMESTHPALGLAFFNHPAGQAEPGSDAFERHARLLAASLAGEPLAESPDPAWLEGFEESWWAKARQPLAERSMALASVLRERRDIERGLTPTTKRPQSTRRL